METTRSSRRRSTIASVATGTSASLKSVPPSSAIPLLSTTIAEGRARTVLSVEAMLADGSAGGGARPRIYATVNGHRLESRSRRRPDLRGVSPASPVVTGYFRLDLDTAEAVSPGSFVGRPLSVELYGFDEGRVGFRAGAVTLAGRLERKGRRP